jgi:hypothetical protein
MSDIQETTEQPVPVAVEPVVEAPVAVAVEPVVQERDTESGKFLPKWVPKRIDELHGKAKDLARERDQIAQERDHLKTAFEALRAGQQTTTPAPTAALPEDEIERRAEAKATQKAAAQSFERNASEVITKGRAEFQDFDESLGQFRHLGGLDQDTLAAAMETGQGHKVLYTLSKDLARVQELQAMSPTARAVALDRMAHQLQEAPKVSRAPAPIEPLSARAATATDALRDEDSIDEWMRKREAAALLTRRRR